MGSRSRRVAIAVAAAALTTAACSSDDDGSATGCIEPTDVFVYLDPNATEREVDAVGDRLERDDRVSSIDYVDKAATLERFKELFATASSLVADAEQYNLPTSYQVDVDEDDQHAVEEDLRDVPEVYEIILGTDEQDRPGRDPAC